MPGPLSSRLPPASHAHLPRLPPRLAYLDADMIVLRNIDTLFRLPPGFYAAADCAAGRATQAERDACPLFRPDVPHYFNAGVWGWRWAGAGSVEGQRQTAHPPTPRSTTSSLAPPRVLLDDPIPRPAGPVGRPACCGCRAPSP